MPVASHMPPENSCQSDLFQMVERRYHMDFNQNHVAAASNELFFKDVVPEINKKVKREPALRDPLRRAFSRCAAHSPTATKCLPTTRTSTSSTPRLNSSNSKA